MLLLILYNILYIAIYFIVFHIVFFQNSNINNCIVEKKIWQYKNNDIFPCPG